MDFSFGFALVSFGLAVTVIVSLGREEVESHVIFF